MEDKDLEKAKKDALENIQKVAKETAEGATKEAIKGVNGEIEDLKKQLETATKAEDVEALKKEFEDKLDKLSADMKKERQTGTNVSKSVSIHDAISEALVDGVDVLKSLKGSQGLALKAITDASFAGNALANQTTEIRRDLYASPYSPLYLRNIFPNVSTDSSSIVIPQVQSITGAVNTWARGTGEEGADVEKPEVTPSYKDVTVQITWLAGITHVNRELLLNVNYLRGSITNTLLYSRSGLFARENKYITDYLAANAVAYAGNKTIAVEKIIDAAFNQLLGNYMNPTHVLMNQADYLTYIKLNKANGSGEYDLPNDLLRGFSGTGLETTVQVVPVPTLTAGTAYVVSAPEFEFINRLSPELKVSEEHDKNFTYNKVSFRVEEMVGFVAKDLNAMVKITL